MVAICPGIVLTNIFKKQDVVDDNVMTKELDDIKEHVTKYVFYITNVYMGLHELRLLNNYSVTGYYGG